MKALLLCTAVLVTLPALHAATTPLQAGDVVLLSDSFAFCIITTPPPPRYAATLIPRGATASSFSFAVALPTYLRLGAIAYSDRAGMIVSSDEGGGSVLHVLHDGGSVSAFGTGAPVKDGSIDGLAPTSTDIFVLASAASPSGVAEAELWRMTPAGGFAVRIPLPALRASSLDVAADQCTVLYTTKTAIARFDACRGLALPEFASTDVWLKNVRIAPDGGVLAIDQVKNKLLRFSPDGRVSGSYALPLNAALEEAVTAFAFEETGANVWVATSYYCANFSGRMLLLDRTTGQVQTEITPETASQNNEFNALATVSEWRAALPRPASRRRAAGH